MSYQEPLSPPTPRATHNEFVDGVILGNGTFGEVCICTNQDKTFAKKKLLLTATQDAVQRFREEVRLLSKLDHPNVVRILDQKLFDRPLWYVMPLYRTSLDAELSSFPGQEHRISKVFRAILDGMEYAHREGVVHRDLKPLNILMNGPDDVVISDFGLGREIDPELTRQTQTGFGMGTPFYMAPEQFTNAKASDVRSDIFSLGRLLYVLHTGPLTHLAVDLSKIPINVRFIISKCCQDSPDRRFQSVSELKQAWLIAMGEISIASATDQANTLLKELVTNTTGVEPKKVDELAELLLRHEDDQDFVHDTLMKVPTDVLVEMVNRRLDDAKRLLRKFSDLTACTSFAFSYTDRIADKCESLYASIADFEIRADMLYCIMEVGFEHNRFYVMGRFTELLEQSKQPGESLAILDRLKELEASRPQRLGEIARQLTFSRLDHNLGQFLIPYLGPSEEPPHS